MQKDSVKKSLELLKVQGIFLLNLEVVPPGIEHLKFFVFKVLIDSTKYYIVKIETIELAIYLISIISIFIAVIFWRCKDMEKVRFLQIVLG